MKASLPGPGDARRLLKQAEHEPDAARRSLAALPVDAQVALVCEAPIAERARLLKLLEEPDRVIPRLPDAELCFTVKALGLSDAGWILAHARPEQMVAAVDLDAWDGTEPDLSRLDEWIAAFADGGPKVVQRGVKAVDPELLVLWLRSRADIVLKPDDDEGWSAPPGALTLEGKFHLVAHREDDDLADVMALLQMLFQDDYWFYFRLLQGTLWESTSDCEEWALRWRTGRLQDLGFPPRDESLAIYARPKASERNALAGREAVHLGSWRLPVWLPEIPASLKERHSVLRAAAELDDSGRRSFFYAFLALANKVAVADCLPLGEAESIPAAIEKAARLASRGLETLAQEHALAPGEVLRRTDLTRLFRLGHSLDREERDS